jgi:lysophospholipase L1-like esterase
LKFEELNRYAEKIQPPTSKRPSYGERFAGPSCGNGSGCPAIARGVVYFQMKFAVAAFFAVMFALFAEQLPAVETKTVLVFGDSLSDGFMLKRSEAYPALLAKRLRAAGLNFQVINASASGGTTDGGLERLPAHLKQRIDIFILELGINDAFRGLPTDQIEKNLQ